MDNDILNVHYDWIDVILLSITWVFFLLSPINEWFIIVSVIAMLIFIFKL